jgi:hypothetical protein
MSCSFKYAELFRETNPELADSLTQKGLQVWSLIKDSKLFKEKNGKYSLASKTTAKRQKQIEFIESLDDFVYLDGEDVVVDLSKVNDLQSGLDWLRKIMPEANIELVDSLIDGIGKGSYNTVTDLITLATKYANKQTVKHEVFHAAFNRLSKEKQEEILNEGSKLFGIPRGESKVITKYSKEQQKSIDYMLKSVDLLQSDKGKQVFEKGEKNKWSLDKILTELGVSKEQKELILGLGKINREEIISDLAVNYSYIVEINTTKEVSNPFTKKYDDDNFQIDGLIYQYYNGVYYLYSPRGEEVISKSQYDEAKERVIADNIKTNINSSYYSNLTVPGGTNYTERNFETPLIKVPKSHAQFNTENTIGFTRGDDRVVYTENDIDKLISIMQSSGILEIKCN